MGSIGRLRRAWESTSGGKDPYPVAPVLPKIPIRCMTMCSLLGSTSLKGYAGDHKGPPRHSSPLSPLRRHAPARTETPIVVPTYMVCIDGRVCRGTGRCKHPRPSPRRSRPYAGGILIHPSRGRRPARSYARPSLFSLVAQRCYGHFMRGDGCKHISRKRLPACCVSCALLALSPAGHSRSWGEL
jgi:hypothetical protein